MTDTLEKLDDTLLDKVSAWIDNPEKMPTRTGLQLQMEMMRGVYEGVNQLIEHVRNQNGRVGKLEGDVKELKKRSIVNWIEGHFKTSVLILFGFIMLVDAIADKISSVDSLNIFGAFLKKWLGL